MKKIVKVANFNMSNQLLSTKTDCNKFLKLVANNLIDSALKTYSDTILFYYLGHLAISNTEGDIVEIGVGGSTYPMIELAEIYDKTFSVIDSNKERIEKYSDITYWPNAKLKKILINSNHLKYRQITDKFSYCHIDGDKNFITTTSDIEFCLEQLSFNGLICQDDYGNHKWPTVTDAVKAFEYNDKIKLIFVGDSSVWFTKPEYYDYWMSLLEKDYEYSLLVALCNINSSKHQLKKNPAYFYMNSIFNKFKKDNYSEYELDYCNKLIEIYSESHHWYVRNPYTTQSMFGNFITENKNNIK